MMEAASTMHAEKTSTSEMSQSRSADVSTMHHRSLEGHEVSDLKHRQSLLRVTPSIYAEVQKGIEELLNPAAEVTVSSKLSATESTRHSLSCSSESTHGELLSSSARTSSTWKQSLLSS